MPADEFADRMFAAIVAMMLDVLVAMARKDFDNRRFRQAEGTAKAEGDYLYKSSPNTTEATLPSCPCYATVAADAR